VNYSTDTFTVAVITANFYGFGNSVPEAVRACRDAGGSENMKKRGHVEYAFDVPCRFWVHPLYGNLHWIPADEAATSAPEPEVTKVGMG